MPLASNFCQIVKANLNLDATYTQAGLLESLISGANVQAASYEPVSNTENGKKKTQLVRYVQPVLASAVTSGVLGVDADPTYCTGAAATYREEQFEINNFATVSQSISAMAMASFCEGKNQVIMDMIKSMIRQLIKQVDITLIASFETVRGNTSAGNTTPISGVAFDGGVANSGIVDAIFNQFFLLDVAVDRPMIVGGANLNSYARSAGRGCCNALGQDISSFTGDVALFTDSNFTANLGAAPANEDWFVYPAGTVQLLDWNLADNSSVSMGDGVLVSSTVLEIPVGENDNFKVDLDITYDICTKNWVITLTKFFGLLNIPADYFRVGDSLAGVNYMLRFRPTTV
jgi:hypothetical protein